MAAPGERLRGRAADRARGAQQEHAAWFCGARRGRVDREGGRRHNRAEVAGLAPRTQEERRMANDVHGAYTVDEINRVKRRQERGAYDFETVHALLDAGALCHVSYVIDGMPYCTPTLYWREASRLYWHGSNSSRMLRNLASGEPACLTVTHLDSLVLARSGFNHSADYRSVMAFGRAQLVADLDEKRRALVMMVDRFFPGRSAQLRPTTATEVNATTVIAMDIERASAKIRGKGVADDDADYELPVYAERLPVRMLIGAPEPCPRLLAGVERPQNLAGYRALRPLEEAVAEAHARTLPGQFAPSVGNT